MRRRVQRVGVLVTAAIAVAAGACSASSEPPPPRSGARAVASVPTRPTTSRPTSSPTKVPPVLASPRPLEPLVSPGLAGEGTWRPAGDRLAGGYAVYTTTLRPAAGLPASGIAWIDSDATRLSLYAGTVQPSGDWPQQAFVEPDQQPALMAAFNSGFKIYDYRTGWYDQGRTAMPLQPGAASLVIYRNGTATVADWGRDASMGPDVIAVRQNLSLLVDRGHPTPTARLPARWGAVLGGGYSTWRSAVGVTSAGDLVYAAGPDLTPARLATLMVAAGAERTMELDINPQWVSFAAFTHGGGIGGNLISGTNLLAGMYYTPQHYFQPYARDFFAVFAR